MIAFAFYNILALTGAASSCNAFQLGRTIPSPASSFVRPHSPPSVVTFSSTSLFGNNIVLEPTVDDPTAFDSLKIGNARIHRYPGGGGGDGESAHPHYVMWYHGRSKQDTVDNSNNNLPPLSTGRIGRATSRNGLIWEKDRTGSASEDVSGVTLGLNKDAWWSFDTAHVGLGNVLMPMSNPAVITEGSVYLMYYMGGSFDESSVADYLETVPESMKDAKVQGMNMKVGVALSQDGTSFGRVEGDHHTGAVMVPYDKDDPNSVALKASTTGGKLKEELYCAWPEVVLNLKAKNEDSTFVMYYSTMTKDEKQKSIAYATSPDGFRWTKRGVCLQPDADGAGWDSRGCARCCVFQDAEYDEDTGTWDDKDSWVMYYDGASEADGKHRILKATSVDGINWKKEGLILDLGPEGAWDADGVSSPHVIRMDDGVERLYYTGQDANGHTAIGVAKLTQAGEAKVWLREQATFSIA